MKCSRHMMQWLAIIFPLAVCPCTPAHSAMPAQSYPNKPIRIIMAAPAGGGGDFVARTLAHSLTTSLGQQVVVDNRGSAGGIIGTELVAKSIPDGYTLLIAPTSHTINPGLYGKLPYDTLKDFSPITQVDVFAYLLVVHSSTPVKTVKEFLAIARAKNGALTYASSGTGQGNHLGMELMKTLAGFAAVHVPYKGDTPAVTDLLGGRVDTFMLSTLSALSHVKAGRLQALAVTSLKRTDLLPDVPTVAESGIPGFDVTGYRCMLAPTGTPREIVARIYQETSRSLKHPEVRDRLVSVGADPVGSSPEEFGSYLKAEIIKWARVVKQSGAKPD